MFFFLSKIFAFLTIPLIWIFFVLLYSFFTKNVKRRKKGLAISILLLYLFSNSFLFEEVVRQWEVPAKTHNELNEYKVGIILGGMITYDKNFDRIQFYRGADRALQAIDLYKKGIIKKLFISGGSGSLAQPDMKESVLLKKYFLTIGIPEQDILIESESKNTRENALFTKMELEKAGIAENAFLLITSALHMKRAQACFKKADMNVETYSTDRYSGTRKFQPDHLLLPNAETLFNWNAFMHEWIGYGIYRLAGYA